ncbi:diguanylate cyclase [Nocardioides sp.]|uniref:sensor domain-containing diguanylate cyclase n=1 Tax=Nocardioides sp. TaxID=35761 RepID=UPI002602D875|nr:diguanylate cyclase [Nocardioides sp.]
MERDVDAAPRSLRLRRLIGRAGIPGIATGIASLLVIVSMLTFLTRGLQPELDDLRRAQRAMRDAHDAMLDQETGVRGYLASSDEDFLEPYHAGVATSIELERTLVTALSGQPALVAKAIDVITAEHAWQTEWAVPATSSNVTALVDTNHNGVASEAELAAYMKKGKALFDTYRTADDTLQNAVRAKVKQVEGRFATTLTVAGTGLVLLGLLSLGLLFRSRRSLQQLVAAPVEQLTDRVDRVRQGDLDAVAVPAPRVAELADLVDGVTAMTASLAERRDAADQRELYLRHKSERLERVLDLSRDLTESLSLRYTTLRLVNAVCELTGSDSADLWLHGSAEEMVLFASAHDDAVGEDRDGDGARQVIDIGVGAIGRAARYGRALPLDETGSVVDEHTTGVAIPMVVGARVVAVIAVSSHDTALDLSLIDGLLLQGASAIQAAQLHAEVEEISHKDALTGLANRRQFDADLSAEVERAHRYDRPLTLIMLDLDHFKRVNDVYGHQRGDEVLQDVAGMLTTDLREIDTAYRYGGEELCVLMPECTVQEGREAAERIRARVGASFGWATTAAVSISAGVAQLRPDAEPPVLVGAADQALYAAKHGGRNQVVVAS